jgi:outer membrane protein TolC
MTFRLVLLMALAASPVLHAQQKMTVEECIRVGLENSKSLHISKAALDGAQARTGEARAARLPALRFSAGYTRLSTVPDVTFINPQDSSEFTFSQNVFDNYSLKLSLSQQLFSGFRLENNHRASRLSEDAARQDYENDQLELVFNVKAAYWNLHGAISFKAFVDENVEQVKVHLKDAQNLMAQGMLTNNDVLKVQVQLSNTQLLQIDAANAVEIARIRLNNVMGLPLDTRIELASQLESKPVLEYEKADGLVKKALDTRNDVRANELRVKAAETSVRAAKAGYYPQLSVIGNYYYNRPNQRYFPTRDEFKYSWDVGLNVNFDLWNWNATGYQVGQARAALTQSRESLGLLKDMVSLEVTQTYLNLRQAHEKIAVAEKGIEQAQENYRITSEKFKKGLALTSDLLDAEVALLQAKTNHTQALVDYELAEAGLAKALGKKN